MKGQTGNEGAALFSNGHAYGAVVCARPAGSRIRNPCLCVFSRHHHSCSLGKFSPQSATPAETPPAAGSPAQHKRSHELAALTAARFDAFQCLCYIQFLRGNSVRVLPVRAADLPSADLQEAIWPQSPFPSFTKISLMESGSRRGPGALLRIVIPRIILNSSAFSRLPPRTM